jgi:hypothetical protein
MARYIGIVWTCFALLLFPLSLPSQEPPARATTGTLTPAGTVDPLHQPITRSLALSAPVPSHPRGARYLHPKSSTSTSAATSASAPLISQTVAAGQTSQVLEVAPILADAEHTGNLRRNFDGVSSLDSAVTNFGAEFEPPDQGLCVGNGFVVEPVNSAFTVYRRDGSVVAGPFNVNVLFSEGLTEFTSDPRCYFDSATHTWFATILFIRSDGLEARTDIAVNTSGDPTTPWTVYHLEATDDGTDGTPIHPGCPCFGDQPLLGIDRENIYVSTNEFPLAVPGFNGAQIYAISKSDLVSLPANVHFVHFDNLNIGGTVAFSVQPAITHDGDDAEYFLNSLDPTSTFDNRIGVWALTNQEEVAEGGIPTLSNLVITSELYGVPPNAVQQGSNSQLNTGDDRMQQVQFIDGELWGALSTALTLPNDPTQLSAIAWFKIHPKLDDHQIAAARLGGQGYIASRGNFLFYPAIQASREGNVAVVFTLSGASFFASAAYAVTSEDRDSFGRIKVAALGTGPYDPLATRWGDYSAAVLDPNGKSFWLATEYMPPLASQTPDRRANWGTRVLEIDARDDK